MAPPLGIRLEQRLDRGAECGRVLTKGTLLIGEAQVHRAESLRATIGGWSTGVPGSRPATEPGSRPGSGSPTSDRPQPCCEALPYRKDDLTASYACEYRRLCDEGGFAVCRLDLRGTGSSEGIATDEYPAEEQADLCEVIAWLAAQPWSNGRVGMYGTSYSGFNSLQLAAERPPALGAVVPIYASDDRYTDDVHYMGGALKAVDLVDYVLYMAAMNALPPVPAVFGEGWRDEWLRRLDSRAVAARWLEEQSDGPYWRHGSLRPGR